MRFMGIVSSLVFVAGTMAGCDERTEDSKPTTDTNVASTQEWPTRANQLEQGLMECQRELAALKAASTATPPTMIPKVEPTFSDQELVKCMKDIPITPSSLNGADRLYVEFRNAWVRLHCIEDLDSFIKSDEEGRLKFPETVKLGYTVEQVQAERQAIVLRYARAVADIVFMKRAFSSMDFFCIRECAVADRATLAVELDGFIDAHELPRDHSIHPMFSKSEWNKAQKRGVTELFAAWQATLRKERATQNENEMPVPSADELHDRLCYDYVVEHLNARQKADLRCD